MEKEGLLNLIRGTEFFRHGVLQLERGSLPSPSECIGQDDGLSATIEFGDGPVGYCFFASFATNPVGKALVAALRSKWAVKVEFRLSFH